MEFSIFGVKFGTLLGGKSCVAPFHLTSHNPRLTDFNFGNFMMMSIPFDVILVQPYKSIDCKFTSSLASISKPLSVILLHWPTLRTSRSCIFDSRSNPSSLIWHELRLSDFKWYKPCETWSRAWSPIFSQKLTSSDEMPQPPSSAKPAIPISEILSQARKFNSSSFGIFDKNLSPLSVTDIQKLRLMVLRLVKPCAMYLSDSSDNLWQSCNPKYSSWRLPSAVSLLRPAKWPMPWSLRCQHDRKFNRFSFFSPQAISSRPVFVILLHPPSSNISKFFKCCAIRPKLESVTCLHNDRSNVFRLGRSRENAWARPVSVTL